MLSQQGPADQYKFMKKNVSVLSPAKSRTLLYIVRSESVIYPFSEALVPIFTGEKRRGYKKKVI